MSALTKQEVHSRMAPMDELREFAEAAVKSKFYGFTSADQMLPLMMVAQAQGRSFVSVVEEYSVIQNRPALKAEAMLSRFQRAGGHIKWTELSDTRCAAIFSHPQCDPVEIDWDLKRAQQAQLTNPMWKKYPRNMLKARVISDGVRTAFPACLGGMYTPEEVGDFEPAPVSPQTPARQLAAQENAGRREQSPEPSPSLRVSFTADSESDGIGKGKSAYAAKKDGDWERVSKRLIGEMNECSSRAEAEFWWEKVRTTDEEYRAWPENWRKTFRDEEVSPHFTLLSQGDEETVWEDEPGSNG